ncbi:MAG: hypothetical protein V1699_05570 [Candidatus Omnitrophota bacterium]
MPKPLISSQGAFFWRPAVPFILYFTFKGIARRSAFLLSFVMLACLGLLLVIL